MRLSVPWADKRLEEVQKVEESVESAKRQIAKWSTPVDPDLLPPSIALSYQSKTSIPTKAPPNKA
eukprot:6128807-Amphidinium_carterae.1